MVYAQFHNKTMILREPYDNVTRLLCCYALTCWCKFAIDCEIVLMALHVLVLFLLPRMFKNTFNLNWFFVAGLEKAEAHFTYSHGCKKKSIKSVIRIVHIPHKNVWAGSKIPLVKCSM